MITVVASGSAGNCYLVDNLIIDPGIPIARVKIASDHRLSGRWALVSHEHGDHSRAVSDLLIAGVPCVMTRGTAKALGFEHISRKRRPATVVYPGRPVTCGAYTVFAFPVVHDAVEPCGFILRTNKDSVLYLTDFADLFTSQEQFTEIMIEVNFCGDILRKRVAAGLIDEQCSSRIKATHQSLDGAIHILRGLNLSRCREIIALHLSDSNSDEEQIKREIMAATGIPTRTR